MKDWTTSWLRRVVALLGIGAFSGVVGAADASAMPDYSGLGDLAVWIDGDQIMMREHGKVVPLPGEFVDLRKLLVGATAENPAIIKPTILAGDGGEGFHYGRNNAAPPRDTKKVSSRKKRQQQ